MGDSIAAANGQNAGRTDDLDAFLALNDNFSGVDVNGGVPMVNGRNFSQDVAARRAALNPAGLSAYSESSASPVPDAPGSGGKGITQIVAELSQPTTYTAQAKDNISRILGTSDPQAVGNFMRANGLTSSTIYAGQDYVIPGAINGLGDNSALGQSALNVDNSRLKAIADARDAQAATYYNANYGNEGRFSTPSVSSSYDDTSWLSRRGTPMVEQPVYDSMTGLPTGMTELVPGSNRAEMSYGDQMAHVGQVGVGALKGLVNGVPKMVMAGVDLLWQSAAYQGATEMGLDTTQSLAAARQSTAGWTDGAVLPYANRDQQLGGIGGELVSPMVYGKSLQLAGAALTAVEGGSTIATPGTNLRAIAAGVQELNPAQAAVLGQLEGFGSRVIIPKASFGQTDLAALSAATGDEFAMFTAGGRRLIARGDAQGIPIGIADGSAQELAAQGWRWSSHVHPDGVLRSSSGDRAVLGVFSNSRSAVLDPYGGRGLFSSKGDMIGPSWLPSKPPLR